MHLLLMHRRRRNIADAEGGNGGTFFLVSIALFVAGSFGALEVATVSAAAATAAIVVRAVAVEAAATGPRAVATGWPVAALPMEAVAIAAPLAHLEAAAHHPMVIALFHTHDHLGAIH